MTSGNAGYSLDSFPESVAIFQMVGPWCSDGAPPFHGGPCWRVLASAYACRLVWIMVGRVFTTVHFGTSVDLCCRVSGQPASGTGATALTHPAGTRIPRHPQLEASV